MDVSRLRRALLDNWLRPLGVTRSRWWVLAILSRYDGTPQTELVMEIGAGKVALEALIDRLEQSSLVKRIDGGANEIMNAFITRRLWGAAKRC